MLVEGEQGLDAAGRRIWYGYSPNYLRLEVRAAAGEDLAGRIREVRTGALSDDGERLLCELA
jgi:hypothetical protein